MIIATLLVVVVAAAVAAVAAVANVLVDDFGMTNNNRDTMHYIVF